MSNPYRQLEKKLGYRFRRRRHLETALTHPSFCCEAPLTGLSDNQRLEFLGDAALGLVASAHLFEQFPVQQEGELTRRRSRLCNRKMLAEIAAKIGLGAFLRLGRGEEHSGGRARPSTLGDAMEAVLGAAYLDGGLKAVNKIFSRLFAPALAEPAADASDNPKGALQEYCQRVWKINPEYRLMAESGPAHARAFTVGVWVRGRRLAAANGPNKREAESRAALEALRKLQLADA